MVKKGQINLGVWVIITAIIAIVILLIFDSAIRSYIITNLGSITKGVSSSTSGQLSTVTTNFTAYNCISGSCSMFSTSVYSWTINFNAQNYTEYLSTAIEITTSSGNYSLEIYPIVTSEGTECSNATTAPTQYKILKVSSGKDYKVFYSASAC